MRFQTIIGVVAVLALAVGCGKKGDKNKDEAKSGGDQTSPSGSIDTKVDDQPAGPGKLDVDPSTATWRAVRIADTGVSVEAVEQSMQDGGDMGEAKYLYQKWGTAHFAVWYGPNRTIESWRKGLSTQNATLGEPQTVKVCGVDAVKQEAVLAARRRTGSTRESIPLEGGTVADESGAARADGKTAAGGGGRTSGAGAGAAEAVIVVLTFVYNDQPFTVSYRVPSGHREAFAAVEKHYFESVTCG